MTRRRWFRFLGWLLCAGGGRAGVAQDSASAAAGSAAAAEDTMRKAAAALRDRKSAAFWLLFDRAMPGYSRLRQDSDALLKSAQVESTVHILKNEGDDRARNLELDWQMNIVQQEGVASTTRRQATVKCRLQPRDGAWRIVSFEPAGFFAATRAAEAWRAVTDAAAALVRRNDYVPADPTWFLSLFDPGMPGYQDFASGITALLRRGDVNSSLVLVSNDGDDRRRTLLVDWDLEVMDIGTKTAAIQRQQQVKLQMDWREKGWRVAEVDPLAFFEM